MSTWTRFAERHPAAATWIREGGLFVIVSNVVTVFKYLILQFLPHLFSGLSHAAFGFPGVTLTIAGISFPWYIIGYGEEAGGFSYFCAYMVAMVIGSKGNLAWQVMWYVIAFVAITCIVNSINCVWVAVAGRFVPDFVYNVGTTVLNGGISMVIFFFVNKVIFPEGATEPAGAKGKA